MQTKTQQKIQGGISDRSKADGVVITYYTDPLCCWSWAFEPQWQRLLMDYGNQVTVRYRMGGLLPSWKNFHDAENNVSRPLQMGPVWMHAQQVSGMPMKSEVWMRDAPASSYPACLAVKAASLQSPEAEIEMLRILREAIMLEGQNIAKAEILNACALKLSKVLPSVNASKLISDISGETAIESFRQDLQQTQYHRITRFPTLVISNSKGQAVLLSGYQQYESMKRALQQLGIEEE